MDSCFRRNDRKKLEHLRKQESILGIYGASGSSGFLLSQE
ncbi:Uncharacterized protein dnm_047920 [Desulfonema magnum]|uniref:Uncharacterized protein n=1 Tax=Desulfonema magnum TaxID=45655 RepID=A0A975BNK9_9BACT|nr:Uncharacterized protein dnm_047920 [Desulfonema magnum]